MRASRGRADIAEDVQLPECLARADHDRAERVLGEEHRQARLLAEQHIQALQERAATREHDAAGGDVAGELRGVRSSVPVTASTPSTRSRPLMSTVCASSL